jgi:hypothetical protein
MLAFSILVPMLLCKNSGTLFTRAPSIYAIFNAEKPREFDNPTLSTLQVRGAFSGFKQVNDLGEGRRRKFLQF